MNIRISTLIMTIMAIVILQACQGPASLVKLTPNEKTDKWLNGQALVYDSLRGVDYEIGFDALNNDQYWFDFHITNRSNMPILIDPPQFYYIPFDLQMNPIGPQKIAALDPEKELLEIDKNLSRNESRSKKQVGISLMAVGADVATSIIVASDDNWHNDRIRAPVATGVHAAIAASGAANEFETEDLNELRKAWASSAIRKTTLDSNYSMHGKVFFPASPDASYIRIHVPVDDQWLQFTFKQEQIPVKEAENY